LALSSNAFSENAGLKFQEIFSSDVEERFESLAPD
jgi:hypothetical protein